MVPINWREIILKALPLIPTIIMYVASYRLSIAKNAKEEKQDQFDRLNKENDKLTKQIDHYRKLIEAKDKEIYDLRKELTKYMAGAIQEPLLNAKNKKEDKDEHEDVD